MRAQDACISALDPVSRDRRPSVDALRSARRSAEAAAQVDERWSQLRERVRDLESSADADAAQRSVDALVQECGRVNQIVKAERDDV